MIAHLPVHLETVLPIDRQKEEKINEWFEQAWRIVAEMKSTPHSTINALLERLRKDLSKLEKEKVREELKREISTALRAGGIPPNMIYGLTLIIFSRCVP